MAKIGETIVPPREGRAFDVPAGHFFRIVSIEGPQVGDLNLWNADDLSERFFSGKTRALHATHVGAGDRLWSTMPCLRPMATISHDTLDWYGFDADGAGVHDVIGTRCDPYTNRLLTGGDYHHCCHSNLARALARAHEGAAAERSGEAHVHDVLNVFACTGFERASHRYFTKASPVQVPEISSSSSPRSISSPRCPGLPGRRLRREATPSDAARRYPLKVQVFRPASMRRCRGLAPARESAPIRALERARRLSVAQPRSLPRLTWPRPSDRAAGRAAAQVKKISLPRRFRQPRRPRARTPPRWPARWLG